MHFNKLLFCCLLGVLALQCTPKEKPDLSNITSFTKTFFELYQQGDYEKLDSFFITPAEITHLYDTLPLVRVYGTDSLKNWKIEKEDLLSINDSVKKQWRTELKTSEKLITDAQFDSLTYDYHVVLNKSIQIPWPHSKNHEPDIYGSHYAIVTIFYTQNEEQKAIKISPFWTGKSWKFDHVSAFGLVPQ